MSIISFDDYKKGSRLYAREDDLYRTLINKEVYWEKADGSIHFRINNLGCCILCYYSFPIALQEHHLAGRANNSELTVTVCANCHTILSAKQASWPIGWSRFEKSEEERLACHKRGFEDMIHLMQAEQTSSRIATFVVFVFGLLLFLQSRRRMGHESRRIVG
jgi:hypothetical protein